MAYSSEYFKDLLIEAIQNYKENSFEKTIHEFPQCVILGDDGSFENLVKQDRYIIYIYEFIENWIESISSPEAYKISEQEWLEIGESLLTDMKGDKLPSHEKWKYIYVYPEHKEQV